MPQYPGIINTYMYIDIHYIRVLQHRFITFYHTTVPLDYTDSPNMFQTIWPSLYPAAEKAWQEITQQKTSIFPDIYFT